MTTPVPAPRPVQLSVTLWLIVVALVVVGQALTLIQAASAGVGSGSAVLGLIIAGAIAYFAVQMRAGKNWARITLTVIGGIFAILSLVGLIAIIGILPLLSGLDGAAGGMVVLGLILALAQLVLANVAIVLMFRPEANPHFR